ncbi:MAG: glycosyltransferase family 29 protein [Betaproteobacteria bacterium]
MIKLLNDCSEFHAGSWLVAHEIRRKLKEFGIDEGENAGLLLVNGEGTLHHDAPGAVRIQKEMEAHKLPAVLINTVWQAMTLKLQDLKLAVARESLSARQMEHDKLCSQLVTVPDIAFCCQHRPNYTGGRGLLVIDSQNAMESRWLRELAEQHKARFIRLCEWNESPYELINLMAASDGVITGRFHGVVFAMLAGAPFMAVPSNTWKTRGLMTDLGVLEHYHKTRASVEVALSSGAYAKVDRSVLVTIDKKWDEVWERIVRIDKDCRTKDQKKPDLRVTIPASFVWQVVKSVVVVGNGPSIHGSRLGNIIDAHDEVVRFNSYRLAGYEADTGSKTTLWSTFGRDTLPADSTPPPRAICVHEKASPAGGVKECICIPAAFYTQMQKDLRAISQHKRAEHINPTSGFLVIRWLLQSGCPHLNLAGFDHFSKVSSKKHHYWDSRSYGRPADHDGDAERELLRPFLLDGRLAYLCGPLV